MFTELSRCLSPQCPITVSNAPNFFLKKIIFQNGEWDLAILIGYVLNKSALLK